MKSNVYKAALNGKIEDIPPPYSSHKTCSGNSVLHVHLDVPYSKEEVDLKFVENILSGGEFLDIVNNDKENPLMVAARNGQHKAVNVILHRLAQSKKETIGYKLRYNVDGDHALLLAVKNKSLEVVEELFRSGNWNEWLDMPNKKNGETAMLIAVENDDEEMCKRLLMKVEKPLPGCLEMGYSIHVAVRKGNLAIVQLLIESDEHLINLKDKWGRTALHYSTGKKANHILSYLLTRMKCEKLLYIKDKEGRIPLHMSIFENNILSFIEILKKCRDCFEMKDKKGRNVLHLAALNKSPDFFMFALARSLKMIQCGNLIHQVDEDGNTPLHLLVSSFSSFDEDQALCFKQEIFPLFSSINMNRVNGNGFTPCDIAVEIASQMGVEEHHGAKYKLIKRFIKLAPKGTRREWDVGRRMQKHEKREEEKKKEALQMKERASKLFFLPIMMTSAAISGTFSLPSRPKDQINTPAYYIFSIMTMITCLCSIVSGSVYYHTIRLEGNYVNRSMMRFANSLTAIAMFTLQSALFTALFTNEWENPALLGGITMFGLLANMAIFYMNSGTFFKVVYKASKASKKYAKG